ncbi:MAG: ABC transporter, permease protein 1 (cluster 1, maltose/g3p/polyamine/iron), partial [uncultured Frankineae bacterium]
AGGASAGGPPRRLVAAGAAGLGRRPAVPGLRRGLPRLSHPRRRRRRLRRRRGGPDARQRPRRGERPVPRRLCPQPPAVGRHGRARGGPGRAAGLGRRHGQARRCAAPGRHLGRRRPGAVRRRHAGLRVPRDGRLRGPDHGVPARAGHRHLRRRRLDLRAVGSGPGLHLLPGAAHGHRLPAGARRPQAAVAGGGAQPGRDQLDLLAPRRGSGPGTGVPRLDAAAVRERLLRLRHRGGAGLAGGPDRTAADPRAADQRGHPRPAEPRTRDRPGHGPGRHRGDGPVRAAAAPDDAVAAV